MTDSGNVYVTNYITGTTILLPDKMAVHLGKDVNKLRQEGSHPHFITVTPDKKYVCVVDLGCDKLYIMTRELQKISEVTFPVGSGPRHVVFLSDGQHAYTADELSSTASVLAYHDAKLEYIRIYSTLPPDYSGENAPAAIRLSRDETHLLVSNRGSDSICVFITDGDKLYNEGFIDTHGSSPRDFIIHDNILYICNELTDELAVFDFNNSVSNFKNSYRIAHPMLITAVDIIAEDKKHQA